MNYHSLGLIPHKRHTQFRRPDGQLFSEQLMGSKGFSGRSSLLYHHNAPTMVKRVGEVRDLRIRAAAPAPLMHHHLKTKDMTAGGDPISGRKVLLFNPDVNMGMCLPSQPMDYFYRNGQCDELYFIHRGSGCFETVFGTLPYREGDYVCIPHGTTFRIVPDEGEQRWLVIESHSQIEFPRRYRNEYGQLLEHSPFCERDLRRPERLETHVERGEFEVRVKVHERLTSYFFDFHPLDAVGWDGFLYPFAFNIEDFEPITGRIHLPPPTHQNFEGHNFVVCSFCPRKYDYHPLSVPVPYVHSNIDSDEVLYYVNGNFMSRKGIDIGSFTLHPQGIPHGPHPGTVEASLGKESTEELAVMLDTFRPLMLTADAVGFDDEGYPRSWHEHGVPASAVKRNGALKPGAVRGTAAGNGSKSAPRSRVARAAPASGPRGRKKSKA